MCSMQGKKQNFELPMTDKVAECDSAAGGSFGLLNFTTTTILVVVVL